MNIKSELFIGVTVLIVAFFIFAKFDVLEKIVAWSSLHEQYEIDEIISTSFVLILLLLIFSMRRYYETVRKTQKLQQALDEIETLKGILPICAYCKKIRDDEGLWNQLESYIKSHSSAEFSHGICPECYQKQLDEMETGSDVS